MNLEEKTTEKKSSTAGKGSLALRLVVIGFLILIFTYPVHLVQDLVAERSARQQDAVNEVSSKWGGSQVVAGPILVVPYYPYNMPAAKYRGNIDTTQLKPAYFVPTNLKINGQVLTQLRARGIYKVSLYDADLVVEGKFTDLDLASLGLTPDKMFWDKAYLTLGGLDLSGLKSQIDLKWQGEKKQFGVGKKSNLFASEVTAPVTVTSGKLNSAFTVNLKMRGSGNLFFVPVAKETNVKISSDWNSPSFDGAFLPTNHSVTAAGFDANWQVFDLNRSLPQSWTDLQKVSLSTAIQNIKSSSRYTYQTKGNYDGYSMGEFGVKFYTPVDVYQKTTRAAKYAMAVIFLVFLLFYLVEAASKRRVNPLQYILVGLALSIFYTLLLSLAEYIPFGYAYFIASIAIVGMVGLFTKSVLKSWNFGLIAGGVLVLLYGFVFILLQSQDYTLLIGSFGLFAILALVMYFSRNVSWYPDEKENTDVEIKL